MAGYMLPESHLGTGMYVIIIYILDISIIRWHHDSVVIIVSILQYHHHNVNIIMISWYSNRYVHRSLDILWLIMTTFFMVGFELVGDVILIIHDIQTNPEGYNKDLPSGKATFWLVYRYIIYMCIYVYM